MAYKVLKNYLPNELLQIVINYIDGFTTSQNYLKLFKRPTPLVNFYSSEYPLVEFYSSKYPYLSQKYDPIYCKYFVNCMLSYRFHTKISLKSLLQLNKKSRLCPSKFLYKKYIVKNTLIIVNESSSGDYYLKKSETLNEYFNFTVKKYPPKPKLRDLFAPANEL